MRIILPFVALFLFAQVGEAEQRNNPAAERLGKLAKSIVIPRIEYEQATGVEILEFIRSKVWSINLIDGDAPRPAHEYRCNPDRLLKTITFKRQNVSYGDALTEVCRELGTTWAIERGTIVISDAVAPNRKKSEQVGGGNAPEPPSHPSTARPTARATP